MKRVLVDQADITRLTLDETAPAPLADGQARLHVQRFALTANNVTYAATGHVIGYWKFFPSGIAGQGIVPVWGVAEVVESRADALAEGTELYGFFPMAEDLMITPHVTSRGTVIDQSPHRADLPAVYNAMTPLPPDRSAEEDGRRCLLQPLIATSYLLFDWLMDNECFGARQIVVGSASSKTGLGLCTFLAEPEGRGYTIVGLTSPGNRDFVARLGVCDRVVTYDAVERLERVPTVYVDMAGDAEVKLRLHTHLGENVVHSAAVGTSHWDKFERPGPMPGAKPQFFFAPSQIAKRRQEWGPGVIETRIEESLGRIAARSGDWMVLRRHAGLEAAMAVYGELAAGRADPSDGHVVELEG